YLAVAIGRAEEAAPIPLEGLEVAEFRRLSIVGLERAPVRRQADVLRLREFRRRDPLLPDARELGEEDRFRRGRGLVRRNRHLDVQEPRIEAALVVRGDVERDAILVHQAAVESGRL